MVSDILYSILSPIAHTHPSSDPQSSGRPKITYGQTGGSDIYYNGGVALTNYSYQIDCWADTYMGSQNLGSSVIAALRLFSGEGIKLITIEDIVDRTITPLDGREKPIYCKSIRIDIKV